MPEAMPPGDRRRIARAVSAVENRSDGYQSLLEQAYRLPRWADVIGITGPPGTGKSTLMDALTAHWAADGARIAILAIDPSSPYSGGAVLGDRIRRTRSEGFENTYFRSLSSRGHLGGLTETATDLAAVLSLFGFQRVIIETVGAGQSDVEIHDTADCTVVLTVPGLGDDVQASKAGLMEIGDVFVVNKADLPGAEDAALDVERALATVYSGQPGVNLRRAGAASPASRALTAGVAALQRRHGDPQREDSAWVPPVLRLVASENRQVSELAATVDAFIAWSERTGRRRRRTRERAYAQVVRALSAMLLAPYSREPGSEEIPASVEPWVERIVAGAASPLEAAQALAKDRRLQ
jgi:LAO/AO transport system kinase